MQQIIAKIGEHHVLILSKSKKLINWVQTCFNVIEWDPSLEIKSPDLYIHIEEGYGTSFKDFHVEIHSDSIETTYQRADYLITANSDYNEATIAVFDEFALKHALHNLYSAFIVHN